MSDLQRYKDFAPTAMDAKGLNGDEHGISYWYVVARMTRDDDSVRRSNFRVLQRDAERACVDVETHTFSHWACGHFDLLLCRDDDAGTAWATAWAKALADYPIADDDDHSMLKHDDKRESWESWARCAVVRIATRALDGVSIDVDSIGVDIDDLADMADGVDSYHSNGDDEPGSYSAREIERIAARVVKHAARWVRRPCDPRAVLRHMQGVALWEV